jgi:predicted kinase
LNSLNIILLRGLPGSGKTTLAKVLSENNTYPIYSIDDYFTNAKSGKYNFDFSKNHLAYKQCEENTRLAMQSHVSKIFVDNTFTLEWEMEPYFKLAKEFNYQIHVITVENRSKTKNVHQISEDQLIKMAEKYKVVLF